VDATRGLRLLVTVTSGGTGGETIDQIAVCAIFKDDAPYLLEWLAFRRRFDLTDPGAQDLPTLRGDFAAMAGVRAVRPQPPARRAGN
jgi:hypothetical protein